MYIFYYNYQLIWCRCLTLKSLYLKLKLGVVGTKYDLKVVTPQHSKQDGVQDGKVFSRLGPLAPLFILRGLLRLLKGWVDHTPNGRMGRALHINKIVGSESCFCCEFWIRTVCLLLIFVGLSLVVRPIIVYEAFPLLPVGFEAVFFFPLLLGSFLMRL